MIHTCSLPRPKAQAIKFVKQMFVDRNYHIDQCEFKFEKNTLQLVTQDTNGNLVMAIFAACKPFSRRSRD